jgi:Lar family restriction alleviation protein
MEDLKPCPCGRKPDMWEKFINRRNKYRIECPECRVRTDWMAAEAAAIKAWNRRVGK